MVQGIGDKCALLLNLETFFFHIQINTNIPFKYSYSYPYFGSGHYPGGGEYHSVKACSRAITTRPCSSCVGIHFHSAELHRVANIFVAVVFVSAGGSMRWCRRLSTWRRG